jgi:hypothetical protein
MAEIQIIDGFCNGDGERGERGERGKHGEHGERGHRGKRGRRGSRGERGPRGHEGDPGTTGTTGATGATGAVGTTGATGAPGPSSGALIGRQIFNGAGPFLYTPTPGTHRALVRGSGGGGGGGGVGASGGAADAAGASGGNSGISIETEIVSVLPLTGGPGIVGALGPGMVGNGVPGNGADSTLLIGGVFLTAPGGLGGNTGGFGFLTPIIIGPSAQPPAAGVDYSSSDLGGPGFALDPLSGAAIRGGDGGSGTYGTGGLGAFGSGDGAAASGNGAGGGGAAQQGDSAVVRAGGPGTVGIWIIEEYS